MKLFFASVVFGAGFAGMLAVGPPEAHAEPSRTMTVDGTDYPVCSVEDCSDQPNQTGVWYSEYLGQWLLELGEGVTHIVRS